MIINENKRFVESEGLDNTHGTFKIQQSSKAFEILSANIYSDKVLAVVREYGCNAYDSHIEAGKADVPLEIHIPNTLEPYYYIKDFGMGISEDDIFSVYTVYFNSTKGHSNQLIGTLGLGCKSAYCYTTQFIVESVHKGMRKTYAMFIGTDGVPVATKVSEEPTTDSNGVKVQIPIKPGDFHVFLQKTKDIFTRFPVMPVLVGTDEVVKPVEYLFKSEHFAMRESAYYSRGITAVQGNVPYPVNLGAFEDRLSEKEKEFMRCTSFDFFFPLGALNIAASREALHYDENTIKSLTGMVAIVRETAKAELERQIREAPTLWRAKQIALFAQPGSVNGGLSTLVGFFRGQSFMWKDTEIMPDKFVVGLKDLGVDPLKNKNAKYYFDREDDYRKLQKLICRYTRSDILTVAAKDHAYFVFDDAEVPSFKRTVVHHFARLQSEGTLNRDFQVHMCKIPKGQEQVLLDMLGNPPDSQIFWTSKMDVPPKIVRGSKSGGKGYKAVRLDKENLVIDLRPIIGGRDSYGGSRSIRDWTKTDRKKVRLGDVGYYVKVNGHMFLTEGLLVKDRADSTRSYEPSENSVRKMLEAAFDMGILPGNIYAVNNTEAKTLLESELGWVDFIAVLPQLTEEWFKKPDNVRRASLCKSITELDAMENELEKNFDLILKENLSKGKLNTALNDLASALKLDFPVQNKDTLYFLTRDDWAAMETLLDFVYKKTKKPIIVKPAEVVEKLKSVMDNYYPKLQHLISTVESCWSYSHRSERKVKHVELLRNFLFLNEKVYKLPAKNYHLQPTTKETSI